MKNPRITMGLVGVALTLAFTAMARPAAASDVSSALLGLKVKTVLLDKLGADALHIDVDAHGDDIALSGTVDKRATSELAETVTKSVHGVKSVKDDIKLAEYQAEGAATVTAEEAQRKVKDGLLEVKLRAALIDKLGADGMRIGTEAASGTVTLEFPKSMARSVRATAEAAAKRLDGVAKVVTVEKQA